LLCTSDTLATGNTDASGYFSITWNAWCEDNEDPCTMEIFAERVQGDGDVVRTSYYSVAIVQTISTSLILDQPTSPVTEGDTVTFTGRLIRNDNGEGIAGQTIYIYDDDGQVDDLIGTGITDSNGYYSIDWIAADIDVQDDVMDTYAYYFGTDEFEASGSYLYYVEVTKSSTSTILQLDEPPLQVNEGDTVTFTGRLTRTDTGEGISGQTIYIYDYDGGDWNGIGHDLLGTGTTDSNGYFSIDWIAEDVDTIDDVMEAYAYFPGSDEFTESVSAFYYSIEVIIQTESTSIETTLTLDTPPSLVNEGDTVTFTGRLVRDDTGEGISGQTISIYEYDYGDVNQDEILATATTDSSGSFTVQWISANEDGGANPGIEVYAYFTETNEYSSSRSPETGFYEVDFTEVGLSTTTLTLDTPPSLVNEGDTVTFTGRLTRTDTGEGISGQTIYIYDYDGGDWNGIGHDLLGTGTTDSNGYFSIDWIAEDVDKYDDVMEAYAYYFGTDQFETSNSPENSYYSVEVIISKKKTTITLDDIPVSVVKGTQLVLSGQLIDDTNNEGIANAFVYIADYNHDESDEVLLSGYTDQNGYFSFTWEAVCIDDNEDPCIVELYSYFDGTDEFDRSWLLPTYKTLIVTDTIETILALDTPPSLVNEGDTVTFTGRLTRSDTGEGIAGQTIYIYDRDYSNFDGIGDDVMGIGVTNSNGYYNIVWIAKDIDIQDDIMEAYAYFPGSDEFTPSVSEFYYSIEVILQDQSVPEVSVNHMPFEPTNIELITFTIFVDDDSGDEGFKEVRLIVDGNIAETWNTLGTHEITLGPFVEGEHTYYVVAEDNQGNWNSDPIQGTKTFFVTAELDKTSTVLTLDEPITQINEGDSISFSGRLTEINGTPISNAYVSIFDFDGDNFQDDFLISVYTDSNGYFTVNWDAICTDSHQNPCIMEIYAAFTGSADFSTSKSPINYYELEVIAITISLNGQIICNGEYCLEENIAEPIPYVYVMLAWSIDGETYEDSIITQANSQGEFFFSDIKLSTDGISNEFFIIVYMTDYEFVNIIDARTPEFETYTVDFYIGEFTSEELPLPFLTLEFNTEELMNSASIYTYMRNMADYFVNDLENEVLKNMGPVPTLLFNDIYSEGTSYWRRPYYHIDFTDFNNCSGCHISIHPDHMPSTWPDAWKDVVGMEYVHAIHFANNGYGGSGTMVIWWAENFGSFVPEALQHIFGDMTGTGGIGNFVSCGSIENNIKYRDPVDKYDGFAIYCPAASILWDFFDTAEMNDNKSGNDEDEDASLSFKVLWDALGSVRISSLKELYDILMTLDVNGDGINDALDHSLVDEIFDLHQAPGGFEQN
jgi:hypothetical protein